MIRRLMQDGDIERLREIHAKHYKLDNFPDFDKLHNVLVVCDSDNSIVNAGGVELIAEGVLLSDYDKSSVTRGKALLVQLDHMKYTCENLDQSDLHVFENSNNKTWVRALMTNGFKPAGNAFFTKV